VFKAGEMLREEGVHQGVVYVKIKRCLQSYRLIHNHI